MINFAGLTAAPAQTWGAVRLVPGQPPVILQVAGSAS